MNEKVKKISKLVGELESRKISKEEFVRVYEGIIKEQ